MLRRPVESAQYTSIAFTERLAAAGVDASVGTVGDALDNSLAESVIGLFKTELIRRLGPWRTVEHVEAATLDWVDWFNHHRLLEVNGDLPPIELEQAHYRHTAGRRFDSCRAHRSLPQVSGLVQAEVPSA